jgi:hypothetical protein
MDTVKLWLRQATEIALILIALGVVLQILFPKALAFAQPDIAGNLINLINQFSGAGLIGLIAVGIVLYLLRPLTR